MLGLPVIWASNPGRVGYDTRYTFESKTHFDKMTGKPITVRVMAEAGQSREAAISETMKAHGY